MFYDRFKQLCDERGISCNRAALEMGLSNATPTAWKKRGLTPKADTLAVIANYFGVSVGYLLGEETKKAPTTKGERKDVLDEVDVAFYGEYKELDEEQKATIRDMVAVMRSRKGKRPE